MRESTGGLKILGIVIVFFCIFILLLAVSINYAQSFRIKNQIIDFIEQYEGWNIPSDTEDGDGINTAQQKTQEYLNSLDIRYFSFSNDELLATTKDGDIKVCYISTARNGEAGRIYKVTTYVTIHIPTILTENIKIPITGQTKFINRNGVVDYSSLEEEDTDVCSPE